jgi:hypothetical protein
MMRGRYYLGQRVPLTLRATDENGAPVLPSLPPTARVYAGLSLVLALRLPVVDRYQATGVFHYALFLDSRFAVGRHRVLYQWITPGRTFAEADHFEILPGGHADGAGRALVYYARPGGGDVVLIQTDGGRLVRKRGPRLAP